jgi:hypothetical protein
MRVCVNHAPTRRSLAVLIVVLLAGYTPELASSVVQAPNPSGCFVYVYDKPDFMGEKYVFNGPARFRTLNRTLSANGPGWDNRIRSLRLGETAVLTIFNEPSFAGRSTRFTAGSAHSQLETAFAGHIQSAVLECSGATR